MLNYVILRLKASHLVVPSFKRCLDKGKYARAYKKQNDLWHLERFLPCDFLSAVACFSDFMGVCSHFPLRLLTCVLLWPLYKIEEASLYVSMAKKKKNVSIFWASFLAVTWKMLEILPFCLWKILTRVVCEVMIFSFSSNLPTYGLVVVLLIEF